MADLTIRTNRHWRNFVYGYELSEAEREYFDWMSEEDLESGTFLRYKGHVYHLGEFERIPQGVFSGGWHACAQDSYFSGVLIRIGNDGERYQIATYYG